MKRIIILLLSFFTLVSLVEAKTQVSLLTSTACNNAIYTVWGHSAIRVRTEQDDKVYNYGVFSFGDGFLYNFVTGQTDYKVDCDEAIWSSIRSAQRKNVYLYEQILNLSEEEANEIAKNLEINSRPENCYYRYNFFYDNCATRPRKMIEKTIKNIEYPRFNNQKTYRNIIHELTADLPWFTVGIDLCLGSKTDKVVSDSLMLFLPIELHKAMEQATRIDSAGKKVPMITDSLVRVTPEEKTIDKNNYSPTLILFAISITLITLIIIGYRRWNQRPMDILIFGIYGVVGSLIFFLSLFSEHPCTYPNYNLLWCNPLQLIFAILLPFEKFRNWGIKYQYFNLATIAIALIIGIFNIQVFHITFYPLMILISLQSISYIKRNGEKKLG
ncbi:MAG: DUF4105 domain-containing protein [Paludibacteraceae bacterium]|nr:DUF4105 domain-containing protein [Paludibacteraceae bacterium]